MLQKNLVLLALLGLLVALSGMRLLAEHAAEQTVVAPAQQSVESAQPSTSSAPPMLKGATLGEIRAESMIKNKFKDAR